MSYITHINKAERKKRNQERKNRAIEKAKKIIAPPRKIITIDYEKPKRVFLRSGIKYPPSKSEKK